MAKNILKEAIADAKAVREVALANAKAALEEAFTPRLQSMLSAKLSEELNEEEEIEENKEEIEETYMEDDPRADKEMDENYMEEETNLDEEIDLEEILNELELEEGDDSKEETVDEGENADEDTVDEAKDKDEETMDEAKDEEEKLDEMGRPVYKAEEANDMTYQADHIHEDKEFNLDALLEEINNLDENEDEVNEVTETVEETNEWADFCRNNPDVTHSLSENNSEGLEELYNRIKESLLQEKEEINVEAIQNELGETKAALDTVRGELNEVNLLNSKLLYVNRIFKANTLDEAQKLRVVETLDKAESVKEAKLIYETVKDTFTISTKKKTTPKKSIRENFGMASKAMITSAPRKPILNKSNDMVARMQKLANIKLSQ